MISLFSFWFRSSMDRMIVSGTIDQGSIPCGTTSQSIYRNSSVSIRKFSIMKFCRSGVLSPM